MDSIDEEGMKTPYTCISCSTECLQLSLPGHPFIQHNLHKAEDEKEHNWFRGIRAACERNYTYSPIVPDWRHWHGLDESFPRQ